MLSLALDKCKEMGLKKVLITCDQDNQGSARTIINNGGVLENEVIEDNGNIVQRYRIELK
jgi:predicted acetyltransferase